MSVNLLYISTKCITYNLCFCGYRFMTSQFSPTIWLAQSRLWRDRVPTMSVEWCLLETPTWDLNGTAMALNLRWVSHKHVLLQCVKWTFFFMWMQSLVLWLPRICNFIPSCIFRFKIHHQPRLWLRDTRHHEVCPWGLWRVHVQGHQQGWWGCQLLHHQSYWWVTCGTWNVCLCCTDRSILELKWIILRYYYSEILLRLQYKLARIILFNSYAFIILQPWLMFLEDFVLHMQLRNMVTINYYL